jgi:transcriptional regulator with XRE-family HTH domain
LNRRSTPFKSGKARTDLALLLRYLRKRIDPDVRALGRYVRLPKRAGKRVTQDEVSEAIGVSREWYAKLESGVETTRTSICLLDRLADTLMVTPEERARLFHVALPELARVQLRPDSIAALEAFARLKMLTKALWAATSVEEIFTTASEEMADWFGDVLLICTSARRDSGVWECQAVQGMSPQTNPLKAISLLDNLERLFSTSQEVDALHLYPQLPNAGDTGSGELHPLPLQRAVLKYYERRRLPRLSFVNARVRTRDGFIGGFSISHEFGYIYSPADLAVFGLFAELASLALS